MINQDDVQLRIYRGSFMILVSVPTLGDKPVVEVNEITADSNDRLRIGPYVVDVGWTGGKPVCQIFHDGGDGPSATSKKG